MMGRAIRYHRKTILIVLLISTVLILYMYYGPNSKRTLAQQKTNALYAEGDNFYLDGKPFRILSGAMHYFRIVPEYWPDRLLKLKAMGLNTVETYVPWNLHEEIRGTFSFDGQLDIAKFVQTAQSLGLHVIVRPGPYICAEWDLGGLPSWLLRDPKMELRSLYKPFIYAAGKFFDELIPRLTHLQYSKGGPIIAWQVENEYLSYGNDTAYMLHLKNEMLGRGVTEMLFTSDGLWDINREKNYHLDDVMMTVNFQNNETHMLKGLKKIQPNKPLMVTEFWSGWFDHWSEDHHILSVDKAIHRVTNILDLGASINFYMFHGGTNFGFMNGGNADDGGIYRPTITSYDYDAPLSEAGDITAKYTALRKVMLLHAPTDSFPKDMPNNIPSDTKKVAYDPVEMQYFMDITTLLKNSPSVNSDFPVSMEALPINNHGGQSFGYTLYQTKIPYYAKKLKITSFRDRAQVFFDSKEQDVPEVMDFVKKYLNVNKTKNVEISLATEQLNKEDKSLEILVENMGRANFKRAINNQRKGILGDVLIDGKKHQSWIIYSLDFKLNFMTRLINDVKWQEVPQDHHPGPGLYKGHFEVTGKPSDTYVLLSGWGKGVCFVNGHNLGRYWKIGPQETLFLPAPWLKTGVNTVVLFDQEGPSSREVEVTFVTEPQLGNKIKDQY